MHKRSKQEAARKGKEQRKETAAGRRVEPQAQPPAAAGQGTSSSNTVPNNSIGGVFFKPLRWGVDSLYLSYPGRLNEEVQANLERLKGIAQSLQPHQRALAQYPVEGHIFEVKDKGSGLFPFILEDNCFRIALSRNTARSLPMGYVKVSSDYLAHVPPHETERRLRIVLESLGRLSEAAGVSRIDLYADFVCGFDMEGWDRHAWVTRAGQINSYAVDGKFSGWTIGQGGPISARLYDKSLEILIKRFRAYLPELWELAGWDGEQAVWRLEFQVRRELLGQQGLKSFPQVMENLNGLWSYAVTEWLKLTLPNPEDQTRSRWPIHPLWGYLSSVDWETGGGPLSRRSSPARVPGDGNLYGRGLSALVSFMAREGITDYDTGLKAYLPKLRSYHENQCFTFLGVPFDQYIAERVAIKAREYNTILNAGPSVDVAKQADEYRRQSDGFNPYGVEE